jgi:hypothetical protein
VVGQQDDQYNALGLLLSLHSFAFSVACTPSKVPRMILIALASRNRLESTTISHYGTAFVRLKPQQAPIFPLELDKSFKGKCR